MAREAMKDVCDEPARINGANAVASLSPTMPNTPDPGKYFQRLSPRFIARWKLHNPRSRQRLSTVGGRLLGSGHQAGQDFRARCQRLNRHCVAQPEVSIAAAEDLAGNDQDALFDGLL